MGDTGFSLGWEDPLETGMATHSIILAGRSLGLRGLADYSPWIHRVSDTTEQLTLTPFIPNSVLVLRLQHVDLIYVYIVR